MIIQSYPIAVSKTKLQKVLLFCTKMDLLVINHSVQESKSSPTTSVQESKSSPTTLSKNRNRSDLMPCKGILELYEKRDK